MNTPQALQALGQSIWLDDVPRKLLANGRFARYIVETAVTGLSSTAMHLERALRDSGIYDETIARKSLEGRRGERLFLELQLEDLVRAADLLRRGFDASDGLDGWASLEVAPRLAHDAAQTIKEAAGLHARAQRPNLLIKIPATAEGIAALEWAVLAGIPVDATLLFSQRQYLAAAEAYLRGLERRVRAGLEPRVASVASVSVGPLDDAVRDRVPPELRNRLGIAVAWQIYHAWCNLHASRRWRALAEAGARPQRLLWTSTTCRDPQARDILYVEALAAADTITTMTEATLLAFADHGRCGPLLARHGDDWLRSIADFRRLGLDTMALAERLQVEGTQVRAELWRGVLESLVARGVDRMGMAAR